MGNNTTRNHCIRWDSLINKQMRDGTEVAFNWVIWLAPYHNPFILRRRVLGEEEEQQKNPREDTRMSRKYCYYYKVGIRLNAKLIILFFVFLSLSWVPPASRSRQASKLNSTDKRAIIKQQGVLCPSPPSLLLILGTHSSRSWSCLSI